MRKWMALLAIGFFTSTAVAVWLAFQLREERARHEELVSRFPSGTDSLPTTFSHRATSTSAAAESAPDVTARSASHPTVIEYADDGGPAGQERLMRNPQYREALRVQERLAYAPRRGMLIGLLGFSPAQADAVIDLQLDQEARLTETAAAIGMADSSHPEAQARMDALDKTYQDQLRALLGEEKRAHLETYMESRETRNQVDRFKTELTESNGLRDDQVEPLIAALHVEKAKMLNDLEEARNAILSKSHEDENWLTALSAAEVDMNRAMNERMHAAAASILTNSQLAALDAMLKRDVATIEARERVNNLQLALEHAEPVATPN